METSNYNYDFNQTNTFNNSVTLTPNQQANSMNSSPSSFISQSFSNDMSSMSSAQYASNGSNLNLAQANSGNGSNQMQYANSSDLQMLSADNFQKQMMMIPLMDPSSPS